MWFDLISLDELIVGKMIRIEHDELGDLLVYRCSELEVFVLEDLCSHADVRLSRGDATGYEIKCKAHGARFDCRSGNALCAPAQSPVKTFQCKIEHNKIFAKSHG